MTKRILPLHEIRTRWAGHSWIDAYVRASQKLEHWLAAPLALGLRLYVAQVFWRSGMLKLESWDSTLYLFQHEYHVPLLPPAVAAVFGTAGELGFSCLLALGLFGRLGALGLFCVNLVAANTFPDISDLGLQDHWLWGVILLVLLVHGPGRWSVDERWK